MNLRLLQETAVAGLARLPLAPVLMVRPGRAGFFGELFVTMNGLRSAERHALRARVAWGAGSRYYEAAKGPNAWARFFEQAEFDFSGGRRRAGFVFPYRPGAHDFVPYLGQDVRQSVTRALQSWCRPRAEIEGEVVTFAAERFRPGSMLGVHVRLTDAAAGAEGRKVVGLDAFLAATDAWLERHPDGGIYVASDEQRVVTAFEARYGGRVCAQDCLRSADGTSIHGHYDGGVEGSPYLKGREVLVDALLLARCDHLIRTHSRVTVFSICWNPRLTYRDLERELLSVDRTPWLHR